MGELKIQGLAVEGNGQYPEFEKLLRKGIPSVYHEEIIHINELIIGTVILVFGFIMFYIFSDVSSLVPIIGSLAVIIGIALTLHGLRKYFSLRRKYRFQNLSRKTISECIMYLDARVFPSKRLDSRVPYDLALHPSFYNPEKFCKEFREFVIGTRDQVTWPIRIIDQFRWDVKVAKQGFRPCSMAFFGLTFILILVLAFLFTLSIWPWMFAIVLLGYCTLQGIYMYIRYLIDNKSLLRDSWIDELVSSETVELEDSIHQIFEQLQAEFPYPFRFYLSGEYPQLVYTGREVTSPQNTSLKEAVLYPKLTTDNE
jgi:hypothetical protein